MSSSRNLLSDLAVVGLLGVALVVVYGVDLMRGPDDSVSGTAAGRGSMLAVSVYARRTAPEREKWIEDFGGSPESERAVKAGLNWLARHQADDGSWKASCLGSAPESQCEQQTSVCSGPGREFPFAQTGLALLAFQAGGHFHGNQSEYSDQVRRGLNWLVEQQSENGSLFLHESEHYLYEHGIAAFALAEACAIQVALQEAPEPRYLDAARRAIRYILSQQNNDGGWRYSSNPGEISDTSVSGWQVLAMKTAIAAGISIPHTAIQQAEKFFQSCEVGDQGRTSYLPERQLTEATTGVGMLVHQFLLNRPDSPLVQAAAPYLADFAERNWGAQQQGPDDYYLWYNCTLAMFRAGGSPWDRWNNVIRDHLIQKQIHEGCERGSWSPNDQWGGAGGRIYSTALAILSLEVYYRFAEDESTASVSP